MWKSITLKKILISFLPIFLCLIFIPSSIIQVSSQSPNINDYGASYKVKVGDSRQYKYSIIDRSGQHYITSSIQLDNGSYEIFNITTNTKFTITVSTINKSTDGSDQIYVISKFFIPGQKDLTSKEGFYFSYISQAFDNRTMVDKFVNDLNSYQQQQSSFNSYSASVIGDYIKINYKYNSSNQIMSSKNSINWKTGWIDSIEKTTISPNGTTLSHFKLIQISNNKVNIAVNYAIDGLTIISLVIVITIPILVVYSFKKFTNSSSQNKNVSFSEFIKTKTKKSNPGKEPKPVQTDKALDMIDEILQENQ